MPTDITDIEKAKLVLMKLADYIGMTARKYNKKGRTIQITLKYSDFKVITRQTTVPATYSTKEIFQTGCNLLQENWHRFYPVRLIGISISGFDQDSSSNQLSLFDFIDTQNKNTKNEQLDIALDKIRAKYGIDKVRCASLMKNNYKPNLK